MFKSFKFNVISKHILVKKKINENLGQLVQLSEINTQGQHCGFRNCSDFMLANRLAFSQVATLK